MSAYFLSFLETLPKVNNRPIGEPLWLSGKVVKKEKINEIKRTRVGSPPRATSLKKHRPLGENSANLKNI
jgi:hypothetical protein